jgi:hypothetical protein
MAWFCYRMTGYDDRLPEMWHGRRRGTFPDRPAPPVPTRRPGMSADHGLGSCLGQTAKRSTQQTALSRRRARQELRQLKSPHFAVGLSFMTPLCHVADA